MKSRLTLIWALMAAGLMLAMVAAWGMIGPEPTVSAIGLADDAATIAAADAAKYEVLRRQQEEARIAQMTRSAIAEATRQEQARIVQQTRTARDAAATENARQVQATATMQAAISRDLALSATAAAVQWINTQATATMQAIQDEHVAQTQAAEATRISNQAHQRNAALQQIGVVILFAISIVLCVSVARGLWKIGQRVRPERTEAEASAPADAPASDAPTAKEPEVLIVDDAQFAETLAEMWKNQERIQ